MNIKLLTAFALCSSAAFAGDIFGGIGAVVAFEENAVRVTEIFPGSPAEIAGLEAGDVIVSADGENFAGLNFSESSARLRGTPGKPVDLRILRGSDTVDVSVRRASMKMSPLGEASKMSVSTAESKALGETDGNHSLLSVVRIADEFSGVFLAKDAAEIQTEFPAKAQERKEVNVSAFSRNRIEATFAQAGTVRVQILNAQGVPLANFLREEILAGENVIAWNGAKLPAGNYAVVLAQNGKNFRFAVTLR